MTRAGNTPCVRIPEWEQELGFQRFWVKDESHNPTGTFKDRRSERIMEDAKRENADKLVLISMGNAAYSLAHFAEGTGIDVCAVVDHNLTPYIRKRLKEVCAKVVEIDLHKGLVSHERLLEMARTSASEKILDVTNMYSHAYAEIVRELKEDLPMQPHTIIMPFGAGEAMTGVIEGIEEVGWKIGTTVYGATNKSSERLKTDFYHTAYLPCFEYGKLPMRMVMEISANSSAEERLQSVPPHIRSEEAAANAFAFLAAARAKAPDFGAGRNIVVINSGSGKVLEESGF